MAESPLSAALTHLRSGDTSISAFGSNPYPHKFSTTTKIDILDIEDGERQYHEGLDEMGMRMLLRHDKEVDASRQRLRVMYIFPAYYEHRGYGTDQCNPYSFYDGDESNAELLPTTSEALQHVFKTYNISHKFAYFLSKQRTASSSTYYEVDSQEPRRQEFWYTAVIRSQKKHTPDGSRKVMNWLRFFCWMDFDITTGSSTCVVFRYPIELKARFLADFDGPRTAVLEQYPVMMHASMLERINTMTREIHFSLCDPMYSLEEELGVAETSSTRLYQIARDLTEFYRRMRQVKTDLDIIKGSTKLLREQTKIITKMLDVRAERSLGQRANYELQMQLDKTFESIEEELGLTEVYLSLYSERCNTSIGIAHSLSSQRSAEVQVKSSVELASLSRDSREDNRSLRVIQLLGAVFLPSSLISSIFGMGFFTTDVSDSSEKAKTIFTVSNNW